MARRKTEIGVIIEKLAEHAFLGLTFGETLPMSAAKANAPLPFTVPAAAGLANNNDVRSTVTDFIFCPFFDEAASGLVSRPSLENPRSEGAYAVQRKHTCLLEVA